MQLRDRKGDGEESKKRRIVSVVKGWIDRKRSNEWKRDGKGETSHNTMEETLLSIPFIQASENEE